MLRILLKAPNRLALVNMLMLYAGKTSGILVGVLFLPLYSRLLGAEQFGVVAVILSLQALLIMLDLGMSTLVSRDVAAAESGLTALLKLIHNAEFSLTGFYGCLLLGIAIFKIAGGFPSLTFATLIIIVCLLWILILQNLYYSAVLARKSYSVASSIQFISTVMRAIISWYVLTNISATLFAFIVTQLIISIISCVISRNYLFSILEKQLGTDTDTYTFHKTSLNQSLKLILKNKALLLSGLVGAIAMQLDKPIISYFMSPSSVGPYFLAVALGSTPVAVLAGPIVQYFQPRITHDLANKNHLSYQNNLKYFIASMAFLVLIPLTFLYLQNVSIVHLWLGSSTQSNLVSFYSKILLIAYGIATIGYVPYAIIIAKQDYKFQAIVSIIATIFVLFAVIISAYFSKIDFICYAYVLYFSIATISFLLRVSWKHVK